MLRVIDKQTHLFLRDDFTFDYETEIGLDVEPAQGLYAPAWGGTQWIETGQAPEPEPQEPSEITTMMLSIAELDMQRENDKLQNQLAMAELVEIIIGGGI